MNTLESLRNRVGARDVAVSAFERTHGIPRPGAALFVTYNDLLRAASQDKADLRCALAEAAGMWPNPAEWV
jgi:hypothetical protein